MAVNIILYEDNNNLRNSVVSLLEWNKEYNILAAMPDAINAANDVIALKPSVILMDIDMPQSNGVDAVTQIRQINTDVPIIMFTVFEDDENIFNAICAGANGYILKKNFEKLPEAIEDVLNGGAPMNSTIAKKVLGFVSKLKPIKNPNENLLTTRENEIVSYMAKGFSYKMIGDELKIATETVRTHIKRIYKKLQVNNATGALSKLNRL